MNEIKKYIENLIRGKDLDEDEALRAFQIVMNGGATPVQISALLVALRVKGETIDEITSAAKILRSKAGKFNAPAGALDTCGTGGDNSGSYNVSTAVAFVIAACGIPVAKHGNRAISSKSGSADVLKSLGVNIEAENEVMEKAIKEAGIGFMMAPKFHSAMRHVAPIRQELGVRTIFNLLGPLSNPASTKYQLLGVFSKGLVTVLAQVLDRLEVKRAWVVHGSDGMDELTTTGTSYVAQLDDGEITNFEINPEDAGLERVDPHELKGGSAQHNAMELKDLLRGKGNKAYRDIVLLNAGAGLVVAKKAKDIKEGVELAREAIDSGAANDILLKLVEISNL